MEWDLWPQAKGSHGSTRPPGRMVDAFKSASASQKSTRRQGEDSPEARWCHTNCRNSQSLPGTAVMVLAVETTPQQSALLRVTLVACVNAAGLIGLTAWGWIGSTIFLLCGGGMDASGLNEPILPFMVRWGSAMVGFGLILLILPLIKNRPRCQRAPWSWMIRVLVSSSLVIAAGWIPVVLSK